MTEEKIKIFLIDDDKFLLDMYSLKFQKQGLDVTVATSGVEALRKLKEGFVPDIIILDIIMPNMDGIELLEKIRNEKLAESSVIIMLTNQADDEDKARKYDIDGFIVKAMAIPSEVVSRVMEIYKNKKS